MRNKYRRDRVRNQNGAATPGTCHEGCCRCRDAVKLTPEFQPPPAAGTPTCGKQPPKRTSLAPHFALSSTRRWKPRAATSDGERDDRKPVDFRPRKTSCARRVALRLGVTRRR